MDVAQRGVALGHTSYCSALVGEQRTCKFDFVVAEYCVSGTAAFCSSLLSFCIARLLLIDVALPSQERYQGSYETYCSRKIEYTVQTK